MKKIVIIGANDFQNQLILKAKEMGFETHVFAWQDGSIGERTADHFYPVSIVEIDEILEKCREIKPDAVATIASDLANITVSKVAAGLGLPGNTLECIELSTNKYAMRSAFLKAGLPTPKFYKVVGDTGTDGDGASGYCKTNRSFRKQSDYQDQGIRPAGRSDQRSSGAVF